MDRNCSARSHFMSVYAAAFLIILTSGFPGVIRAQGSSSPQSLPTATLTGADMSSKCLECHKYVENHHPIGVAPSNPENYPFPLYNGKITCLTCHIEEHAKGSVNLLRGGPYSDRRGICFKCHAQEKYAKIDAHLMLDGQGSAISVNGRPVCLLCHSVKPDPAKDRTGDVQFRADVAFLCWRCHPVMANPIFFSTHFLKKPSEAMEKYIKEEEQEMQVTIPLVPRGRITCSTCHNPHQKGVILYGPSARGADQKNRLRLPPDQLCIACHNFR